MINSTQIPEDAPVVCSDDGQFAVVDHMEGNFTIKLKKDKKGQHHYIPLSWVTKVDDKVHVDRPGSQAMKEWSTTAKTDARDFENKAVSEKTQPDRFAKDRAVNEGMGVQNTMSAL